MRTVDTETHANHAVNENLDHTQAYLSGESYETIREAKRMIHGTRRRLLTLWVCINTWQWILLPNGNNFCLQFSCVSVCECFLSASVTMWVHVTHSFWLVRSQNTPHNSNFLNFGQRYVSGLLPDSENGGQWWTQWRLNRLSNQLTLLLILTFRLWRWPGCVLWSSFTRQGQYFHQ